MKRHRSIVHSRSTTRRTRFATQILLRGDSRRAARVFKTWGKDLSGSLQGAGGVGGLLAVRTGGVDYYPAYDDNGNVVAYDDDAGAVVASYTYDAFGNTRAASGPLASVFAHRFSTKPRDPETGFYYYGYRFYAPVLGRWMNRDPIEERGGNHLYRSMNNSCAFFVDTLGLYTGEYLDGRTFAYKSQPDEYCNDPLHNGEKRTITVTIPHYRCWKLVGAGEPLIGIFTPSGSIQSSFSIGASVPFPQTGGVLGAGFGIGYDPQIPIRVRWKTTFFFEIWEMGGNVTMTQTCHCNEIYGSYWVDDPIPVRIDTESPHVVDTDESVFFGKETWEVPSLTATVGNVDDLNGRTVVSATIMIPVKPYDIEEPLDTYIVQNCIRCPNDHR